MSMIWAKIPFLRVLFASADEASDVAERWHRARRADPELAADLIRLGGVLITEPFQNGEVVPPDLNQVIYEKGRRDFALQLLSMMQLTKYELTQMMETNDAD